MKVDRRAIVDAALDLLNEVGLDALSTRLLAERLQVRQPALYWHFRNRQALLDAMNREMLARGHTCRMPAPGQDWRSFLLENTRSFRRALVAYRDGGRVHAGTEVDPDDLGRFEAQLRYFMEAGMSAAFAMELLASLGRYALGCVMDEQADVSHGRERGVTPQEAADYPLLHEAMSRLRDGGHEAQFESGLALLIAGAEAKFAVQGQGR